ncbi:MAG: thymidine phosphorylase, partial [bacterium]|nr:thymidine phosphorylase [bacterium]
DGAYVVVLRESEARNFGVQSGDTVELRWRRRKLNARAYFTSSKVHPGEVGLYRDIWEKFNIRTGDILQLRVLSRPESIKAIISKLLGHTLSYAEMRSIIRDIVDRRLTRSEISYFVASSFARHYSDAELYYLTKAMAETGQRLSLPGVVVDKHSVGGLSGNRTSMVMVPIIAASGLIMPKTSSRAVTSPAGTADTMEVLAPVEHPLSSIKKFIRQNKCCLVWGGSVDLAPADDRIIRASQPLGVEPLNKMIVSIMSKKVAAGIKYLVIDLPVGPKMKIPNMKIAWEVERKFLAISKRFGIKTKVLISEAKEPVGRGIGPALEARDVLRVLQGHELRPVDLEKKSVRLAGELLELAGKARRGSGQAMAQKILDSGEAWKRMKKLIALQGGDAEIRADEVVLGAIKKRFFAKRNGIVKRIDDTAIDEIARMLGAPNEKLAGIHLHKRLGNAVRKDDPIFTLYAQSRDRMKLAEKALLKTNIFTVYSTRHG